MTQPPNIDTPQVQGSKLNNRGLLLNEKMAAAPAAEEEEVQEKLLKV